MQPIELRSDNCAGAAPEVLAALAAADAGSALAYGGDDHTDHLRELVREVFAAPQAEVFPVLTGTAANALGLSALCPPWGAVLCHETAHVLRSECAATSMFGGGAALRGLPGADYKLTPGTLRDAFAATNWGDNHHSQPAVVSVTNPTDLGTVYSVADVAALADVAATRGLRLHLDGARLANALVTLGADPAEFVRPFSVFSLGATKNGAISTDAIVSFDPAASEQLHYRVKRAGHVASKMRYQSAQLTAYLTDGLWLRLAQRANEATAALAAGLRERDVELLAEPQANIIFARVGEHAAQQMAAEGLLFYDMGGGVVRLVTSFQTTATDVTEALRRIGAALSSR